jgi:arsenate reductase
MVDRMAEAKPSVLFVCTGNAGRSQISEALFRERMGDRVRIVSAGVAPWDHLHPMAVKVMAERGNSLDGHFPKSVETLEDQDLDLVVTIGDPARAMLPKSRFSSSHWIHWDIKDPADADGTPDSESVFRRTAEAIEGRLPDLQELVSSMPPLAGFAGRLGIGTGLWSAERFNPSLHLPLIKECGFQAIELNLFKGQSHFDWDDARAVTELARVVEDLGMNVWSVHSPDLTSIADPDGTKRQTQVDILKHCLDLAAELGAKAVPSHALLVGPLKEDPAGSEARINDFLAELTDFAEGNPAQVAFENAGFPAGEMAAATRILERLGANSRAAYGFVLDTGHANIDGDLGEIEDHVSDHLISLHLNDNDGKGDTHLAPGEGTVDWSAVGRILKACDYRGVVMYEIEPGEAGAEERMKATLEGHSKHLELV